MWKILIIALFYTQKVYSLWDAEVQCPTSCTCNIVHLTETSVYGFKNHFQKKQEPYTQSEFHLNNEVTYDDNFETDFDNTLLRSTTCLLQTDTESHKLLQSLPKNIESLRLIQGFESGNKTILFNDFLKFDQLKILELQGTNLFLGHNNDSFIALFDTILPSLEFLNLENVHLKKIKNLIPTFENKVSEEGVTFEYTQQLYSNLHPLTIIQKGPKEEKVLPYKKYKEQEETDLPLFVGFTNLQLLRVSNCKLNSLKWEMFDGLHKLEHLILEKNSIMFLPDFVFYGTPNLKSLSLAWNNLLNIQVTDLAGLLELEYLDVSHNNFSQLSELSLPPFPKLKLADFGNNPITAVFPSTFEVLNTTDSLILGSTDTSITLIANSFLGLKLLKKLTLENVVIPILKTELLFGMPNLKELSISGNITEIQYDAFSETYNLEKLILSQCRLRNISMDGFMGLAQLKILDLSKNNLENLPPNVFDPLISLKELYLNENKFTALPEGIFAKIHPKLIRLNQNPWHCSCQMSDWKPMIINKVKQKHLKVCDFSHDKGVACPYENRHITKYIYDNQIAPKCASPKKFINWSVFHVMRKQLGCPEFRPKFKKRPHTETNVNSIKNKLKKLETKIEVLGKNITNKQLPSMNTDSKNNITALDKTNPVVVLLNNTISLNYSKNEINENEQNQDSPTKISLFYKNEMLNTDNNNEPNELNLLENYKLYPSNFKANMLNQKIYQNKMLKSLDHGFHARKIKKYRKKGLRKTSTVK